MTIITIPKKEASCNQIVKQYNTKITTTTTKDRREGKGRVLALSRRMYRLRQNSDVYYVESESSDDHYYLVKFKPDGTLEGGWYCSCKDNSMKGFKCKHLFAIEFAIKWETIKEIEELPIGARQQQYPQQTSVVAAVVQPSKSYLDDEYDF